MGRKRKPMAPVSQLNGQLEGWKLRLELLRQAMLLGKQSMQFLDAMKRVIELGMRIQGIVKNINAMSDADMRRHLADIDKARAVMDAALRLGGGQMGIIPQPEAMEVPGSERRQ